MSGGKVAGSLGHACQVASCVCHSAGILYPRENGVDGIYVHFESLEYVLGFLFRRNPQPSSIFFPSEKSHVAKYTPSLSFARVKTVPNWFERNEPPQNVMSFSLPTLFTAATATLFEIACPLWTPSQASRQSPSTGSMPFTQPIAVG